MQQVMQFVKPACMDACSAAARLPPLLTCLTRVPCRHDASSADGTQTILICVAGHAGAACLLHRCRSCVACTAASAAPAACGNLAMKRQQSNDSCSRLPAT